MNRQNCIAVSVFELENAPMNPSRPYMINPDDCPHDNVMGETFAGRRTGDSICQDCGMIFSSRAEVRLAQEAYVKKNCTHEQADEEYSAGMSSGEYVCRSCGETFSSKGAWQMERQRMREETCEHESVHDEVMGGQRTGEVVCDSCGKEFSSDSSWQSWRQNYLERQNQSDSSNPCEFEELIELEPKEAAARIELLVNQDACDLVHGVQ